MPDDSPRLQEQLVAVAGLAADRIAAVSYASVTRNERGAPTTVATSSAVAVAVDEAQYAEGTGPCLDALAEGSPVADPDIATTMLWPGFREAALRLGLRASLSIPLFAGRGTTIAALNLYSRNRDEMASLTAAVWEVFDPRRPATRCRPVHDHGAAELIEGLDRALAVRATIQQAIGVIMARSRGDSQASYLELRLLAAEIGISLGDVAERTVAESGRRER